MRSFLVGSLGLVLLAPASAAELTPESVHAAIEKGAAWLKQQQAPDGSFPVKAKGEVGKYEAPFVEGTTALALLTLLKAGTKPDDPAIEKGFAWLMERPPAKVYSVSLAILALEARFAPPPSLLEKNKEKPYETVARGQWGKFARPQDRKWLDDLVKWLIAQQETSVWRYPSSTKDPLVNQDNSNTQYAMLALKSASRLGCEIPASVFAKVGEYFVLQQDATGPEVPVFPVPAADGSIATPEKPGVTQEKRTPMHARGWSYAPREVSTPEDDKKGTTDEKKKTEPKKPAADQVSTGSMTNSGIAALVIAKSELEKRDKAWWAKWGPRVDQAIRDGCAWLAHHFDVKKNPPGYGWKFYYLYGLERAGVMAGTYEFGKHDWYDEGALHLLELQKAGGEWPAESLLSEFADTCFAVLFLKRATIPLVKLNPKRTMTGVGNSPEEKNDKKK